MLLTHKLYYYIKIKKIKLRDWTLVYHVEKVQQCCSTVNISSKLHHLTISYYTGNTDDADTEYSSTISLAGPLHMDQLVSGYGMENNDRLIFCHMAD